MVTDGDIEELHSFAASIGMKRSWFQDKPGKPHYDLIVMTKVKLAISSGAMPISSSDVVRILRGEVIDPEIVSLASLIHYRDSVPTLKRWLERYSRKGRKSGGSGHA